MHFKMGIILFLSLHLTYFTKVVFGNPFEVNDFECKYMVPVKLGVDGKSGKGPYTIKISHTMYDYQGEVHVDVISYRNSNIRGIFLQARLADCGLAEHQDKPVGRFLIFPGEHHLKVVNCSGLVHSAVMNTEWIPYNRVRVKWIAPSKNVGPIYFRATIAESKERFWMENYSETVRPLGTQYTGMVCPQRLYQKNGCTNTGTTCLHLVGSVLVLYNLWMS